jgi:predicted deacetylase
MVMGAEVTGQRRFLVLIHDVAPPFVADIDTILGELEPLVGRQVTGAFVPLWHGCAWAPGRARAVAARFEEVALHGLTHQRRGIGGPVSWLTAGSDELCGLSARAALARVRLGRRLLQALCGRDVAGLIPPAWMRGRLRPEALRGIGLRYLAGMFALTDVTGRSTALATWSWDTGRVALLSHLGQALGSLQMAWRPSALPCVVLHPQDVRRGFLPHALAVIRSLCARGWRPAVPRQLVAHPGAADDPIDRAAGALDGQRHDGAPRA